MNPRAFWELRRLITIEAPTLVFLCITKLNVVECDYFRVKLGFDGLFVYDYNG